jgi:hypothetical protein
MAGPCSRVERSVRKSIQRPGSIAPNIPATTRLQPSRGHVGLVNGRADAVSRSPATRGSGMRSPSDPRCATLRTSAGTRPIAGPAARVQLAFQNRSHPEFLDQHEGRGLRRVSAVYESAGRRRRGWRRRGRRVLAHRLPLPSAPYNRRDRNSSQYGHERDEHKVES